MLLNPSHTVTYSGLPPDVLEIYVRYKKGTRAIVKWLSQHAPAETRNAYLQAKTLPINDLAKLARVASKHVECMPEVIHFHFRETIAARSSLSKHFRRQTCANSIDSSTINHEHFTSSLAEIYASLCECCGEPADHCQRPFKQRKQITRPLSNHFTHLSIEDCSCSDDEHELTSQKSWESCDSRNETPPCPSTDTMLRLSGDDLGDAIETIAIIQQINELYNSIQDIWRRASTGGISLVVAAAVTNVACASLRALESQLRDLDPAVDLESLHNTCGLTQGRSSVEYETGPNCENQHQMLEDMQASWKAIKHINDGKTLLEGIVCVHNPADCARSPEFATKLVQGILYLAASEVAPDAVIRNGTPVYPEIGYLVTHPEDSSNILRSTLALHLLSISYSAYISGLKIPATISSCRLSALKLAQQAQASLFAILTDKISFPCMCLDTIAFHLDRLRQTLQKYTAHKCWDIFFQSPWVAGNHILEMLDMCFYYGMRLIRYRHYVGSVLHSYNVLIQLAAMEEIPTLEELCTKLASVFFPGGQRPTSRFAASWARFVGARLKFKKGHRGHNHRESWCMAVPSHTAKRAAGLGIGTDGKAHSAEDSGVSEILDLIRMDYHIDDSTWDVICGWEDVETSRREKRRSDVQQKSSDSTLFSSHSTPSHSNHLQDLSSYLAQDLKGTLPTLRLNLFTVFESCAKIVQAISNSTHTDLKDQNLRCICFATTILTGGDRIRDSEATGKPDCWSKSNGERQVVEDVKKAIRNIMNGVRLETWLWNI